MGRGGAAVVQVLISRGKGPHLRGWGVAGEPGWFATATFLCSNMYPPISK